jgi:hypothetical protein
VTNKKIRATKSCVTSVESVSKLILFQKTLVFETEFMIDYPHKSLVPQGFAGIQRRESSWYLKNANQMRLQTSWRRRNSNQSVNN